MTDSPIEAQNRNRVVAMIDALNRADLDDFAAFYAENVEIRLVRSGFTVLGRDGVRSWLDDVFDAFDDFANDVVAVHCDGDVAVVELVARGNLTREFGGMEPDPDWRNPEVYVYALEDGVIVEARGY
jgi:ketosteroid isomerase-like protein